MAPLKVKVNTFFQENQTPFIDPLSKFYIIAEGLFGLNRLPVLLKDTKYYYTGSGLATVYTLSLIFILSCKTYDSSNDLVWYMSCGEYVFCVVFSFLSWKRTARYYNELNKFDTEIGCRPKTTSKSIKNVVLLAIFNCTVTFFYGCLVTIEWPANANLLMIWVISIHCIEVYYYGHLLSLLIPRLCLITYYVESALSSGKSAKLPSIEEFISFKHKHQGNGEMKKLMDLYHIVIKAYDFLIDAIKWQLLIILITSFISTLCFCYHFSITIIRSTNPLEYVLTDMGLMASEMIPLFSPCMFGDRVHNEVRRLRELLASRLYENKLDKPGRSTARALLALTEARDLSFSLLRMLQIDISLPFKFIGLLVTYLIILLQFEKVINPSSPTNSTST